MLANPPHQFFSSPILHLRKTQGGSRSYLACPHWPPQPWGAWPSVRDHLPCFPYICYSDSFRQRLHYPTGRNLFLNHRDYNSIKGWWEQNVYCVAFPVLIYLWKNNLTKVLWGKYHLSSMLHMWTKAGKRHTIVCRFGWDEGKSRIWTKPLPGPRLQCVCLASYR